MFAPHRKHVCGLPQSVTGIALFFKKSERTVFRESAEQNADGREQVALMTGLIMSV
jgi:hypothetical protein